MKATHYQFKVEVFGKPVCRPLCKDEGLKESNSYIMSPFRESVTCKRCLRQLQEWDKQREELRRKSLSEAEGKEER